MWSCVMDGWLPRLQCGSTCAETSASGWSQPGSGRSPQDVDPMPPQRSGHPHRPEVAVFWFMTGQIGWAYAGIVTALIGGGLLWIALWVGQG